MEDNNIPILVVLTPVRNEAWILQTFLEATSLWADHIIIADQMSTDGSREIAKRFPKVRLIDNNNSVMHMAATRRMLFDEANQINGDKIIFALDADEFLSGDFLNTSDWKKIIKSEVGDVFMWQWMNLLPGCKQYTKWLPYYWAAHVGERIWDGQFPDNFIHEWRLPWPKECKHEYVLNEFSSLHFARVNIKRQANKERFYQISTVNNNPEESGIRMYRSYHAKQKEKEFFDVPNDVFNYYLAHNIDLRLLDNSSDIGQYYLNESSRMIEETGITSYRKLDIWSKEFCSYLKVKNPQNIFDHCIHTYLSLTSRYANTLPVRIIDKILKKIY